ncbi:hypothetical protein KI387_011225, partial [Taxus chinensis]
CDYHTLRKKYVYLGWCAYVERLIYDILSIKPISLEVGDIGLGLVYLQIKPNMENNKYVKGEFTLPAPPKRKHTMENIPGPKPIEPIKVEDDEECEDSGGLEHRGRRHPTNKGESEYVNTPPQPQEGDDEGLNAIQEEHRFKRVFRRTRTQGTNPTMMCRSPRNSPQKEETMQRRRKL